MFLENVKAQATVLLYSDITVSCFCVFFFGFGFSKVTIMEDPEQNIQLRNLSIQQSANEEEALNLLFLGDTNRMIAEVRKWIHLSIKNDVLFT